MQVCATLSQLGNRRAVLCSILLLISSQVVRSFAVQSFFGRLTPLSTAAPTRATMTITDDPYIFLEEVESEESLQFAKDANDACLKALGDPTKSETTTYDRVLKVLESDDRIPHVKKYGRDDDGNEVLYNFWKDSKNPKGIWRRTTMESYCSDNTEWTTVLDVDELAKKDDISWVWKGPTPLQRARDPLSENGKKTTRALLYLSRGGSDASHVKEFDLLTGDFVTDNPFILGEAKTRASYKSRDVLLVGTDTGPDSLTDSGYPRTVREWVRGTDIMDAPVIFEGDKKDVSVSVYFDDQRENHGGIYEVRSRSLTFYTSKYWARKVLYEHLLAPDDPARNGVAQPEELIEIDVQEDAEIDFVGNLMIISLRSDWEPVPGQKFMQGSLIYTDAETFLKKGKEACEFKILFEPTRRTAYETYTLTQNYLILSIMDDVKSKLEFYKVGDEGNALTRVGGDKEAVIRSCGVGPLDSIESDKFWFTTSGYTQPSTLCLADASRIESSNSDDAPEAYVETELKSLPDQYDSCDLEVAQRTAISKDGTAIPYFLISKRDTVMDGNTPTLLYGYGGFEISLSPHYIATAGLAWLERGGAYVEANIRGGGEFGPNWHQAALKENRNKAYEDFIAVAEDLIASGLCKPSTLAIRGGSNGGLLMGNMYTMRPDLFGAIHCAVPLLDMKRYHTLLAGASWMAEYGDPETDDWEKFLHKYSPYHNIDPNCEKYPPILFTTSTRDDRVHPAHARKMVKKLWDMGEGKNWPVYYYENIEGGHGGAADAKQSAFMTSLAYDFMFDTLSKNAGK